MREIKFRFWDNHLKKMCDRKPYYNDFSHQHITPLQFTGLLDKNETMENYKEVLYEYQDALIMRQEKIDKLYDEIKKIKKLKV